MSKSERPATQCPVGRTLERVGDHWTLLILRDAAQGLTRFDQFEKSLGVAPNILTKRLAGLVENKLLEKRAYSERPPRYEYRLTDLGRDFGSVLTAMLAFGNRHFAVEGVAGQLVDRETGLAAEPIMVDRISGKPITEANFAYTPGPAAGPEVLDRVAFMAERRAKG
ncbi:helix-turn-helix domain-containing protein [Caulobacter sp. FWC2]|uniref:winged helix-turn-helix transcriptional regulator n=1 Tax=Caulobacter sp. FWC2 TaxID=69664 RepID=UPI000C14A3B8|nr:helix-turn-helix domain-containing protein [Caulobacter sp. FWC2]PIB93597.1 transcriptional regulator [Caulobacter sp. FWC2]